jgi:soluble lytic murein transglycosylase-like protein
VRILLVLAAVVLAAAAAVALLGGGDAPPAGVPVVPTPPGPAGEEAEPLPDPFAWDPGREGEFVRRATRGASHALYAFSPGGAEASAARTARRRPQILAAAARADVDPDTLEALVLLESAGRPDAVTPFGLEGAVGLTQILAETARNLLGMRVDLAASRRLTRRLERARRRGREMRARRLERARARVDERFDPVKALAGTARYLRLAERRLGREDLAFVSYHMGIGNLEDVLGAYGEDDPSYAQLYFDSTPADHPRAFARLSRLGDDSANYFWKVLAAREIMRLLRDDRGRLRGLATLHAAKGSAEEVLHPPGSTEVFATPGQLRAAWEDGEIVAVPDRPALTGLRRDPDMGELARRLRQPASLYRGLRPEALALALYLGAQVQAMSGTAPLVVTSAVRDVTYQRRLIRRNPQATLAYSLHTTGWAFDVLRRYRSPRQARAFQFLLDRLELLDVIAWVREPAAIHVTVADDAEALLPLLERLEP